ncbi:MAG TPA: HD-GYP domain-containing protein [Solirubrobacteraceae bacterium]|nr:HD-GYP domain-containing protein [Solirubrobacteraceae bacterium]
MSVHSETELIQEIARLRAALSEREQEAAEQGRQLERYAADLRETFKQERARAQELRRSYTATVRALSNAVEWRDAYTAKHAERVTAYGVLIAKSLGIVVEGTAAEFGFLLHDIGKLAISDAILHKEGPLTEDERARMIEHPVIGVEIMQGIDFLEGALDIVRHHHERWDGNGYPDGLAAEQIPLAARIFAVADVFDALTTNRPYRQASSWEEARRMISAEAGKQFDPQVVEAFNSISDQRFAEIAAEIG